MHASDDHAAQPVPSEGDDASRTPDASRLASAPAGDGFPGGLTGADRVMRLPRRLPSPVAALLSQIADVPGVPYTAPRNAPDQSAPSVSTSPSGSPVPQAPHEATSMGGFSYAASVILPQTGWSASEFLPRLVGELSSPGNLSVLEREMHRQAAGAPTPYSLSLRGETGTPVELLVTPRPLRGVAPGASGCSGAGDEGPVLCATLTATPLSSLSSEGPAPAWSERTRLLNLLDRLPAYVVLLGPDYSIRYENRGFRQLFGPGVGRPCYEVIRGQNQPCALCPPFDVFDSRTLCVCEWACPERRSAFRIYSYPFEDVDGSPLVLKLGIDITSGVRAQEALSISEGRYRSITDNLTLGIAVLDRALGITASNPRLREWFGEAAAPGGLLCRMLAEHCGEDNTRCPGCACLATFRDGQTHEWRLETAARSGGRRSYRLTSCPILAGDGGVDSVIVMLEDETDRLRVEERLQRARKLEAMGTLATGIAHEINQPLSALQLYAGSLEMLAEKDRPPDRETLLARLSLILGETARIRDIIDHMRALVAHGDTALSPTLVEAAVDRALGLVGAQLRAHRVTVERVLPPDLPAVRANPVQLEQVVINLVVNAMHALDAREPADGQDRRIRIEAAYRPARRDGAERPDRPDRPDRADRAEISDRPEISDRQDRPDRQDRLDSGDGQGGSPADGEAPAGRVLLTVADNGPGLQGLEDRVFDPFFTTKDPHKGLGLGLAIVHSFVESWGGEISVSGGEPPMTGAAFTLALRQASPPEPDTGR
ncbi:MAG: PAS domain-containing sensor histidine kinase [Desulfovibrio sp.]|nr:PAS domain-containing sensor histidine kinase [Desulfovibrio sp.]